MFVSLRSIRRLVSVSALPALAVMLVAGWPRLAPAQNTHLWTQSRFEEFEKGTPQGVAIGSDGHLREGPALSEC